MTVGSRNTADGKLWMEKNVIYSNKLQDNRWVVPHNAKLLKKFKWHLNIEICSSMKALEYLYTNTCKGPDRACLEGSESCPDPNW